jgi:mannose-1-phosphate guanylyltransferase
MVEDRSLFAVESPEYWIDAGTPATYLAAQLDLIGGRRRETAPSGVRPGAQVAETAHVERSVVMEDAVVSHGARVVDSAVLPGARIGVGSEVIGSIVGPRAVVGPGATVTELSVLGDDVTVADGARVVGERVPEPAR